MLIKNRYYTDKNLANTDGTKWKNLVLHMNLLVQIQTQQNHANKRHLHFIEMAISAYCPNEIQFHCIRSLLNLSLMLRKLLNL